jgi:hypothetical protein
VEVAGHWALPAGGPLLEGSGEKGGYDPEDLQSAYDIPSSGGSTQTIALVDAYGYSAAESDLATYRSHYGLGACTQASGCFKKVNEEGEEANYPKAGRKTEEEEAEAEWDVEAALDLDMASAACPACHITLVEATTPSVADLAKAADVAATHGATEISNSYGIAEENCEASNCEGYNADYDHPGILVTASAGDSGYDDYVAGEKSANFPATSPYVVAVGGTSLRKAANARGWSEEVWAKSGGGCSRSEAKPIWQSDSGCAHRTGNDVAAVASTETPVSVYNSSVGGWINVGGTSVSAPLVAGIEAHTSEYTRSLPGAAAFYQDPGFLFDVTSGRDGKVSGGKCTPPAGGAEYLCSADVGYDGPTGNGTPDSPLQLAEGPPSVATSGAVEATEHGATLEGTVNPNDAATTYYFEYGTSISYGTSAPVPAASAGEGKLAKEVSQSIAGLEADTTYHYRLVATNEAGTKAGKDMSFRTAPPTLTGLNPESGPSVGGTTVTITGTNFAGVTQVKFGAVDAESFTVESETSISAVSPAGTGVVDVTVTTPVGTSTTSAADEYLYTQGPELTGAEESGEGSFGESVAVSADGNTVLIGGGSDDDDEGAVWVFTRSGGVWAQQGPKLVGDCEGGCTGEGTGEIDKGVFGDHVALSADGNTALISAPWDDGGVGSIGAGAVWVFTRSGGVWTQQAKLVGDCESNCADEGTGAEGHAKFGEGVALSEDGDTALVGGNEDDEGEGAAWVFTRSGGVWAQQGPKLVGDCRSNCADEGSGETGGGSFGQSVALSTNGDTALIGGSSDDAFTGAAWTFTRANGAWAQQGSKLTPSNENGNSQFGQSVALSADGDTALIGGFKDGTKALPYFWVGAAWVYTRSNGAWTQGPKLEGDCKSNCSGEGTGEIGEGDFGDDVALSADGDTALISASLDNEYAGAAWLFTHSGRAWVSQGQKLTAAGEGSDEDISGLFGAGVALSAEGTTVLIGSPGLRGGVGTAWVLALPPIPTVTGIDPSEGPAAGGTVVRITGTNLTEVTTVSFGAAQATDVEVKSATEVTAVSPPGVGGAVDVTISTPERTSPADAADEFTYEIPPPSVSSVTPSEGSTLGATTVTIKGANLADATEVRFGATKATAAPIRDTASEIEVQSPASPAETVDVTVTTAGGVSPTSSADRFTYALPTRTVSVSSHGSGSVSAASGAIQECANGSGTCSGAYVEAATIVLTATPAAHNQVVWEGCTSSSGDSCTVLVGQSNVAVGATFMTVMHTLTVLTAGGASGAVTSMPAGIDCATTCSAAFGEGTEVTLIATPDDDVTFDGWSGDGCAGIGACVVILGADEIVTATFSALAETREDKEETGKGKEGKGKEEGKGTASAPRSATVAGKGATLTIRCQGNGACRGTLELTAKIWFGHEARTVVIGYAKYSIAKGASKRVKVKLDKAAVKLLKRHGHLVARLGGKGVKGGKIKLAMGKGKGRRYEDQVDLRSSTIEREPAGWTELTCSPAALANSLSCS